MDRMFTKFALGSLTLTNRFVFPPIKTAYGTPDGKVTGRQLTFYSHIAAHGPGLLILEPVSVTQDGREHPKQLSIHLPDSADQIAKIADTIHKENRLACLHLNHAGAGANPKASGGPPKAPSVLTCPLTGQTAEILTIPEIDAILAGYRTAAQKAATAGIDALEIQCGHGYLVSQFLNGKINKRTDSYGRNRLLFASEVLSAVALGAPGMPIILRISGNEMSPEFGIGQKDVKPLLALAEEKGVCAIHVGMGTACFSPPWYFHHSSLPEKPQMEAVDWVRKNTTLPIIIAGRMGRKEKVTQILDQGLADLVALGRPLIADPDLVEKWQNNQYPDVRYCGYCLQGCLHRIKSGQPLGCNINPTIGLPELPPTDRPLKVLIAGGGPAGMSAAFYLSRRGHHVTLTEKENHLGGQFSLAWQAPGKQPMQDGLDNLKYDVRANVDTVITDRLVDAELMEKIKPDLLIWATGAVQNIPEIQGLEEQNVMTSIDYFKGTGQVKGPRVLVIGAGRTGLEIVEKLGKQGFEVTATKRTDPIGSMMEMITKKLCLMRIEKMPDVTLMPHTIVKNFGTNGVEVEKDGEKIILKPFHTVILSSGMLPSDPPDKSFTDVVANVEVIGDAQDVKDIFSAIHAGYDIARKY